MAESERPDFAMGDSEVDSELVAKVHEYLEGTPKVNIGALFLPPIWGPAKGIWATILWYPAWMMADNVFFAWYCVGDTLSVVTGVIVLAMLIVATFAFAYYSRPIAAKRAIERGKTREQFQRSERIWAVCCIIAGIGFFAFATYYNLCVRVPLVG